MASAAKAVIFDLGNVLVDYNHQTTLASLATISQAGLIVLQEHHDAVGQALGMGEMDAEAFHQYLMTQAGTTPDFDAFLAAYGAGITRDDSALAYAVTLQQRPNVVVAVMSNTNQAHAVWLDALLPELAEFDLVMMSNEVHLLKPDPEIYLLALQLLDVTPEQAIFIDDRAENVTAAQAVGMAGILHADWAVTHPALEAWLADRADTGDAQRM